MSFIRTTRRSGFTLLILGMVGLSFFWLTDSRFGPTLDRGRPAWHPAAWLQSLRGNQSSPIDAADDAMVATLVGWIGSLALVTVGGYLLSRRKV